MFESLSNHSNVVLCNKQGFFISAPIYKLNNEIFCKVNGKYLRLYKNKTSNSNYHIVKLDLEKYKIGLFEKLEIKNE